jgi:hypothetical protein
VLGFLNSIPTECMHLLAEYRDMHMLRYQSESHTIGISCTRICIDAISIIRHD